MIKGLGLTNFKPYQKESFLNFKKLNLFLGPNSSGKSSYIKALDILKENIEVNKSDEPIIFNEKIGDYKSLVNGGHMNRTIVFKICLDQDIDFLVKSRNFIIRNSLISFLEGFMDLNYFNKYLHTMHDSYSANPVVSIEIQIKSTESKPNIISSMLLQQKDGRKMEIKKERNAYYLYQEGEKISVPNIFFPKGFLFKLNSNKFESINEDDREVVLYAFTALSSVEAELQLYFRDFYHLGPFRTDPSRIEILSNDYSKSVGYKGQNLIPTIMSLFKDSIENEQIINDIGLWLRKFEIGNRIEILQPSKNRFSLSVENKYTKVLSNIVDVGTGTAQLLPVIVESIVTPRNSIIVIEEPESHIHPNAQANLADLFVDRIEKDNKTFFIETHSIFLLQKIQILIAKEDISPEDVGIFYFDQNSSGTVVKELKLDYKGQFITEFPKGFYDVAYNLSSKLADLMWGE